LEFFSYKRSILDNHNIGFSWLRFEPINGPPPMPLPDPRGARGRIWGDGSRSCPWCCWSMTMLDKIYCSTWPGWPKPAAASLVKKISAIGENSVFMPLCLSTSKMKLISLFQDQKPRRYRAVLITGSRHGGNRQSCLSVRGQGANSESLSKR